MVKIIKLHRIGIEIDIIINNMHGPSEHNRYTLGVETPLTTIFDNDNYLRIYINDFYKKIHYHRTQQLDDIIISKIKKKLGKKKFCTIIIENGK